MAVEHDIAFPTLSDHDLAALTARGHPREVRAGEVLFAEGDRNRSFFVVLEGSIEIVGHSMGVPHVVAVHHPGQFSGDVDMLSGRAILVTGRAAENGRVLELTNAELRQAVAELPDLGRILAKAFLMRRALLLGEGYEAVTIIGSRFSPDAHRLRDFASRNGVPVRWMDLEADEQADALLRQFNIPASATPILLGSDGEWVSNPSTADFARCMGLETMLEADHVYDLVVVGAGPAGLAASVYAASEGLEVLTLDALAAGGQAGTSSLIENYLGFPAGISGDELTRNALFQAQKFGAKITVPAEVRSLGLDGGERVVTLTDGARIRTRCVLVASGVEYRKLDVPRFGDFEGAGIYYAATEMEARLCRGEEVVVVGAGNSAGQAIMFLSKYASRVHVVVRGQDLGTSMSRYLVDRVERMENVTIHRGAVVSGLEGNGRLSAVQVKSADGGQETLATNSLYLFIGADPNTGWLHGCVDLDRKGFVLTGNGLSPSVTDAERWRSAGRDPFLLETSLPGVFAAGDVRAGSAKRVASAVGEGAMAVGFVHAHIARPV
ncbi:MAG TPA: FAD-dependent oxidoreductase [Gemmatimonadales bacterium]|nr:FAD-dependent oxidoreductase [Gemmatimonadales bacterium]